MGSGPDHLADAWQRLEWANDEADEFDATVNWLLESGAYSVSTEFDGERWQVSFNRVIDPDAEARQSRELARSLGAFLDHSRAALNYLAYQLAFAAIREDPALKGKLRPEVVEWPIFFDPRDFESKHWIKKFPDKYKAAMERVQPYDGRFEGLWLLHDLAREFRHRVIHPAAIYPAPEFYEVRVDGETIWAEELEVVQRDRLKHGDILLFFSLPYVNPHADVDPQVTIAVGIDHPLCSGEVGTGILNEIRTDVDYVMREIAVEFFSYQLVIGEGGHLEARRPSTEI